MATEILAALQIALAAEPYVVGLVNDIVDLYHKFKSGQHVTPEELDAAVNRLDTDVDAFDNLKKSVFSTVPVPAAVNAPDSVHALADTHQPRINPLP